MPLTLKEAVYTCAKADCRHVQVITFFAEDQILPVTCCVKCRAGFDIPLQTQMAQHIGMFPGKATVLR